MSSYIGCLATLNALKSLYIFQTGEAGSLKEAVRSAMSRVVLPPPTGDHPKANHSKESGEFGKQFTFICLHKRCNTFQFMEL